ncbi:histidine phosphatase family protein [Candidatus Daviesbacteria bacterium]|nr:histidine phosphatase family protein [Candidatus Daviesbacteria bacterium]
MAKKEQNYCILYIVRHGETDWNAEGKTQGESNIPLNNKGIQQAKALNKDLKDVKFNAIFSSDLVRAKKTAEIIAVERKLAIETTHLLRERRYGKLDGTPYHMMQEFHRIWENLSKKERVGYRPYGGYETDEEAISRFITFLREVAARYLGKTVLIVSHGGMMMVLLNHLSEETYFVGAVSNSAYIKLESDGVDFFIKELQGIKNPNE